MNKKGFSLLELVVVILVAAILTAIALPHYLNAIESARTTEAVMLWGRQKNWVTGRKLSQDEAERITRRLEREKLKYFTVRLICQEKQNPGELCWEAEFNQVKEDVRARYKLVTVQNFNRLACVPLNEAGEDFCISQTMDEKNPEQIGDEKAYLIR